MNDGRNLMMRYAGLASRYLAVLGLTAWLGFRFDDGLDWGFPLFVWALPMSAVVGLIVKAVIDTSDKSPRS
jgi:hypothetical protein